MSKVRGGVEPPRRACKICCCCSLDRADGSGGELLLEPPRLGVVFEGGIRGLGARRDGGSEVIGAGRGSSPRKFERFP